MQARRANAQLTGVVADRRVWVGGHRRNGVGTGARVLGLGSWVLECINNFFGSSCTATLGHATDILVAGSVLGWMPTSVTLDRRMGARRVGGTLGGHGAWGMEDRDGAWTKVGTYLGTVLLYYMYVGTVT